MKFLSGGYLGYGSPLDSQLFDFPFHHQEPAFDALPPMEMSLNYDPIYPPLAIDSSSCMFQGVITCFDPNKLSIYFCFLFNKVTDLFLFLVQLNNRFVVGTDVSISFF